MPAPAIKRHLAALLKCDRCPRMHKPVVVGRPVESRIMLVGQAPGDREPLLGRPFAWTAGKTLFKWFSGALGWSEDDVRDRMYFAAICRCFPGKQRQMAAKYIRSRTSSSLQPRAPENHLKSVLPAVHAKGRPSRGSLSPGAWPTSMILLSTGRPTTTGLCIRGQRSHLSSAARCLLMAGAGMAKKRMEARWGPHPLQICAVRPV